MQDETPTPMPVPTDPPAPTPEPPEPPAEAPAEEVECKAVVAGETCPKCGYNSADQKHEGSCHERIF